MTTSSNSLTRQAALATNEYFLKAIDTIDNQFGQGYAKCHPELIVGFMTIAAMDYQTSIISKQLDATHE